MVQQSGDVGVTLFVIGFLLLLFGMRLLLKREELWGPQVKGSGISGETICSILLTIVGAVALGYLGSKRGGFTGSIIGGLIGVVGGWALGAKMGDLRQSTLDFVDAVLLALGLVYFFIRPFVVHAFFIPSESMVKTLLVGDRILVNKFVYQFKLDWSEGNLGGWTIPGHQHIFCTLRRPRRQEVVVFHAPPEAIRQSPGNEQREFIKRFVGIPGDLIRVEAGTIMIRDGISGEVIKLVEPYANKATLTMRRNFPEGLGYWDHWARTNCSCTSENSVHKLSKHLRQPEGSVKWWVKVPDGHYFAMGDNRPDSLDSRKWGFVPEANLVGKALVRWWPVKRVGLMH